MTRADDFDPADGAKPLAASAPRMNLQHRRVFLRGTGLRQVADYLAQSFAALLGLESCVLYLYDHRRANLVAVTSVGRVTDLRRLGRIPLDPGTGLAALAASPGEPGGSVSLPLWDSRRLLGVVYGRMNPGRVPDAGLVNLARAMARGGALALSVALAKPGGNSGVAKARLPRYQGVAGEFLLNPYLTRYLESALRLTQPDGAVVLSLLRLSGPGCLGRLPYRGCPLPAPRALGRGFGLGRGSNRVAVVWLGLSRQDAAARLRLLMAGSLSLDDVIGRAAAVARPTSAAVVSHREDRVGAGSMLAAASDLLDLQTCLQSTRRDEGRDPVHQLTGDAAAMVMDSHVLAQEIDRQRQVLQDAIANGCDFQDRHVREISERLDRLIVVMMRLMGHRGAVP